MLFTKRNLHAAATHPVLCAWHLIAVTAVAILVICSKHFGTKLRYSHHSVFFLFQSRQKVLKTKSYYPNRVWGVILMKSKFLVYLVKKGVYLVIHP